MSYTGKVLVLGASSWLGYLLLNKLHEKNTNLKLGGTLHTQPLTLEHEVTFFQAGSLENFHRVLAEFQPTSIVNFLRGENEEGLRIHQAMIEYCQSNKAYYLYASSALALDGYKNQELTEQTLAKGVSPYGAFKAACEQILYDSPISWGLLRFASVQGWVPHKETRNEGFLKKLASGEVVQVDRGVVQNRMLANKMIEGVAELLKKQLKGIFHFGAIDSSEEFVFLRKQAEQFGYDPELVISEGKRDVNLVTVPDRIFKELGAEFRLKEQDALNGLLKTPGLAKYRKI